MSKEFIPISKPWITEEEAEAVKKQILSCRLTNATLEGGETVRKLERLLAEYTGAKHVIAVNSGTSALLAALMALEIKRGDEVITPSFTFLATANTVLMLGAKPVFADITLDNYGLDPEDVKKRITNRTKAIILVHLYGYPAYVREIKEFAEKHNICLIEDAAQALGSKIGKTHVGNFGLIGCFSMYPSKLITTGEGGFLITNNDELAYKLRLIRNHGQLERYKSVVLGLNLRLPEILASLGIVQMRKIEKIIELRRRIASIYNRELNDLNIIIPREKEETFFNWNYYTIRVLDENRDKILSKLREKGIGATVYYSTPVHSTPLYLRLGYKVDLPNTTLASKTVLSLPIYPEMSEEQAMYVAENIRSLILKPTPT